MNLVKNYTDKALLTSIVGEEGADYLINRYFSIPAIAQQSIESISRAPKVGIKKATALKCALELANRKEAFVPFRVTDSVNIARYLQGKIGDLEREVFRVMYFNRNNELVGEEELFAGGVSATIIDTKIVLRRALEHNASAIIVAHNHPSGNLRPSQADLNITRQIKAAGEIFDIQLLDHLIVSFRGYYSFADEGML